MSVIRVIHMNLCMTMVSVKLLPVMKCYGSHTCTPAHKPQKMGMEGCLALA